MAHGWYTVSPGEAISVDLWNEHVRDQGIARVADNTARDALTVTEGQMVYVESTDHYWGWNGTTWKSLKDIT